MMWARTCLLLAWAVSLGSCVPARDDETLRRVIRDQSIFGITHLDIRDAILALDRNIKAVANKLDRHEAREAQLASSTTKTLASLSAGQAETAAGVQAVARQMAVMEERLLSMEALILTTDERQRMMLGQLTQGLDRLLARDPNSEDLPPLPPLPPMPSAPGENQQDNVVLKVVKKLIRKVGSLESFLRRDIPDIGNQVSEVRGEYIESMRQMYEQYDSLNAHMTATRRINSDSFQNLNEFLEAAFAAIQKEVQLGEGCSGSGGGSEDVSSCLEAFDRLARLQDENLINFKDETQSTLDEQLGMLQTVLLETYAGQTLLNTSVADLTQSLMQVNTNTQGTLGKVTSEVVESLKESVNGTVKALEHQLQKDNAIIMNKLEDRALQTKTLQNSVLENHTNLSAEISSLKEIEQVMIHTADSVLDTKRSIEFGIRQIILELGEIVKSSGSTINTTLSDQINSISFAILKNQNSALTNMTAKMEQEISQVWRQIGIMYQQMTQSVDLLDQLKDTTKQHMNASLSRVGDMDGTVGKINTKVADVESNLNYLLGRLSLVVSEFNLMKNGVGEELMRLRDNLAKENNSPVEFAEGGEPPSASRYDVNRKREAVPMPIPIPRETAGTF